MILTLAGAEGCGGGSGNPTALSSIEEAAASLAADSHYGPAATAVNLLLNNGTTVHPTNTMTTIMEVQDGRVF